MIQVKARRGASARRRIARIRTIKGAELIAYHHLLGGRSQYACIKTAQASQDVSHLQHVFIGWDCRRRGGLSALTWVTCAASLAGNRVLRTPPAPAGISPSAFRVASSDFRTLGLRPIQRLRSAGLWKAIRSGFLITGLLWQAPGTAQEHAHLPAAWNACFHHAGHYYGIAPQLLIAIAHVESRFDSGALHANPDGSWDVGLMQINTRWLAVMGGMGLTMELLYEPCTSIWIGTWVLAGNVLHYGYDWQAVGAYNAGTAQTPLARARRGAYARLVARHLEPQ